MIKDYSGEFEFARLIFPAPAELVTDFDPKNLASFTIGQLHDDDMFLTLEALSQESLLHVSNLFGKNSPLPTDGPETEVHPVCYDESAMLERVVHCWPRFGEKSVLHVRLDTIWVPGGEARVEQHDQIGRVLNLADDSPAKDKTNPQAA